MGKNAVVIHIYRAIDIFYVFAFTKTLKQYKKVPLCYKLYKSLLASWFLTDTCIISRFSSFIHQYWCSVFCCAGSSRSWANHRLSPFVVRLSSVCARGIRFPCARPTHHLNWMRDWGGGGRGWVIRGEVKLCGMVPQKYFGTKLIWRGIYCASPRPEPDSQLGSCYHKWLGRRAPQSMHEYNNTTAITICPLIDP